MLAAEAAYDAPFKLARCSYEWWPDEFLTARVLSEGQAKGEVRAKVTAENQAKKLLSHIDCRSS